MLFGILTLLTALAIAGVAAWFSIVGLMLLFSGMPMSIAVMAGTLEIGKLLTASWLYRYWNETSLMLRAYLTTAVVILMVITSIGIFGYLSKAASDQAGDIGDAVAVVERIDAQIDREENKIDLIEDRILGIGGSVDISASIDAQEDIRDGAWARVQGDIDYNQEQIENVREQLTVDIAQQDSRLSELDKAVNELRSKGVEVVTLDEGGVFARAETEKIDYIAQANELRASQQAERDEIKAEKQSLRDTATSDINVFQSAIDNYRTQAQDDINGANGEINRLRNQSSNQADDNLIKIDTFNNEIDSIYNNIVALKDEKFDAESKIRALDREVGPIKYLAQLIYGSEERDILDQAIRLFILMLVFVFDPLAVMLVIAANQTLLRYGINLESSGPPTPPKDDPTPGPLNYDEPVTPDYGIGTHGGKPLVSDDQMKDASEFMDKLDDDDSLMNILYDNKADDYQDSWSNMPEEHRQHDEVHYESSPPSAVDDAADVMSGYDGRDKTFFETINEPLVNIDNQKTEDIVKQIEKTEKLEEDLNNILGGKTKAQLLQMAADGGIEIPAQLSKADIVANVIQNYDSITKKKI
tara:strand:+ start:14089 stop:15843 length:1755 start_codon:yes stop_codon:yes gene_type:complete